MPIRKALPTVCFLILAAVMALDWHPPRTVFAQQQTTAYDCSFTYSFTGATAQTGQPNSSSSAPCVAWRVTYSTTGFSTVTVQFETSPDNSTWTAVTNSVCSATVQPPCVIDGASPIAAGVQGTAAYRVYAKYVRVNVTAVTGTGSGTATVYGYKGTSASVPPPGNAGTVTSIATTSPITGGPITTTGTIGCATCLVNWAGIQALLTGTIGSTYAVFSDGSTAQISSSFTAITSGTNTVAAMVVGTGASLATSGSGTITATALAGTPTLCSTGQAPTGILASGNATGCAAFGTGTVTSVSGTSPISVATGTTTPALSLLANVDYAFTASQSITRAGIGTTSTDGVLLTNTTAAAAGAQQWSPRLHFTGKGWQTTGPASESVDFILEVQPSQATTHPTASLVISSSVNGGAYGNTFYIKTDGSVGTGALTSSSVLLGTSLDISSSGGYLGWYNAGLGVMHQPSDGVYEFQNHALNNFTRFQLGGTTAGFAGIGVINQTNPVVTIVDATGGGTADLQIANQKSATGQRYVCIDTNGKLVSSAAACVGT
jgi:hypothetical protein